jgi:ribosomal protein L11 methyltransferase
MKWIEAKIVFDHPDKDLAADLISDVFYDFGLQGVVVDDPNTEPNVSWAYDAVARSTEHAVTGYFCNDNQAVWRCNILEEKLRQLSESQSLRYRIRYKELDEQDWAHSWKAHFWPQKIGAHIVVKPTWREYQANSEDIVIELDPGMAFGTGTHPTTSLCIAMIEKHLKRGDSFLDVGTGSGILMIAAAKLGAGRLCGIDKDELAVDVAADNLELNCVSRQIYQLKVSNRIRGISELYDFVVANIFTHVILELLPEIPRLLVAGGVFVCSGIIKNNKSAILSAMRDFDFKILDTAAKEEWVAIAARTRA